MQIIHTIKELREWRKNAGSVAFVPTMGNLHEGHLALVREAKKRADNVVVSIFVNRLQFGQGEDFDKYPRTLQQDADKLANEGVAVVFAPDEKELYPHVEQRFNVEPPNLQTNCAANSAPGISAVSLLSSANCSTSSNPISPASAKKTISSWRLSKALSKT